MSKYNATTHFYKVSKVTVDNADHNLEKDVKYFIFTFDTVNGKHPQEFMYESIDGKHVYDYDPSLFYTESELRCEKLKKLLN
jgi:hypothetical protein